MKKRVQILYLIFLLFCLTACSSENKTKVVLTGGFAKDEVFQIEDITCTLPEAKVYLTNTQNLYEKVYGTQIWQQKWNGRTLEGNIKDTVLAQVSQVKALNLLARKYNVVLNGQESQQASQAAEEYYKSLNQTEITQMNITKETLTMMYQQYALADKLYHYLIKDLNPEISDDEARIITVENIQVKTASLNDKGKRVPFDALKKEEAYQKAEEILKKAKAGADFDQLSSTYNEGSKSVYSFGKGEMESGYEKAAFDLGRDEISQIIETQEGYNIIKCISPFNQEETDANKIKIAEKRKEEVFGKEYDAFVSSLVRNLNEPLWDSVTLIHDEKVTTATFFDVYKKYFPSAD